MEETVSVRSRASSKVAPMAEVELRDLGAGSTGRPRSGAPSVLSAGPRHRRPPTPGAAWGEPRDGPRRARRTLGPDAFLNDGHRLIDFVLAFKPDQGGKKKADAALLRNRFEKELRKRGLELEYEGKEQSQDGRTAFIKLHASWDALTRQAELEGLQMPFMRSDLKPKEPSLLTRAVESCSRSCRRLNPFALPPELRIPREEVFTDAFDRKRESHFLVHSRDTFFSSAQRAYLTWALVSGTSVVVEVKKKKRKEGEAPTTKTTNIVLLLKDSVYTDAFPLHDADLAPEAEAGSAEAGQGKEAGVESRDPRTWPLRRYLYEAWARPRRWKSHQPLDQIRDYYGEQVGIYFAWLGFYTKMLLFPAAIGLLVFVSGLISFNFDRNSAEVCSGKEGLADMVICRSCPGTECPFVKLPDSCSMVRFAAIFDNGGATLFSLVMAMWAIVFLELWKRYQAELCARWDVSEGELGTERVRTDYELSVATTQRNPVTGKTEPFLPRAAKLKRLLSSVGTVAGLVLVVLGLLAGVMLYKTAGKFVWEAVLRREDGSYRAPPSLLTSLTASIANGLFVAVMSKVFSAVAWRMTLAELPRTETAFEESYTYKVFLFQFVNFYGALFYLAFVRGQFVSPPNEQGHFEDRCPPGGCLLDVTIQLFVIFTGKQAINNFLELCLPLAKNWWARRGNKAATADNEYTRWEKDLDLFQPGPLPLFGDYLEMTIQFGFVTMFVTAMPLAPLFALLNNVLEIRVDAYKTLTQSRRFIPVRVKDIGPWFQLLSFVTKVAILTNALVIAFTTNFVDKLVYATFYEGADPLVANNTSSFAEFAFSEFRTQDWCTAANGTQTRLGYDCVDIQQGHQTCFFRDYRERKAKSDGSVEYVRTSEWWHVMVAKLAFVIAFEHIIIALQSLLQYAIPDVPEHVTVRLARENHLQREEFMAAELEDVVEEEEPLELQEESEDEAEWDEEELASELPAEVTLNQVRPAQPVAQRKKPLLFVLGKKLMLCLFLPFTQI